MSQRFSTDILIIGGGAAGLATALHLADHARVTVLSKGDITSGSSHWAQGGIAAAWLEDDSWQAHVDDTLIAGAGLCRREVVDFTAKNARQAVEENRFAEHLADKKRGWGDPQPSVPVN